MKVQRTKEGRISKGRVVAFILIAAVFLIGTFLLALRKNLLIDEIIVVIALTATFLLSFLLILRNERLKNRLSYNATSYIRMVMVIIICFVVVFIGTFFADFFFPVMPLAFILTTVMNGKLSLSMTIFYAALFSIISGSGSFVLLCLLLVGTIGALMADYLRDEKLTIFI